MKSPGGKALQVCSELGFLDGREDRALEEVLEMRIPVPIEASGLERFCIQNYFATFGDRG